MKKILTGLLLIFSYQAYAGALPTINLKVGNETIKAEVASTPSSQQLGLMYRKAMPDNAGMLFIFDQKAGHCFWMKNTVMPIAIAFIDDDGKITNVEEMKPQTEDNHCPTRAIRFALEMNAGWFDKRKLGPSTIVEGLPKL
jgi:uncharacterized protein